MKILDMLSEIEEGQGFTIDVGVTIGKADVHALNLLSFLYNEINEDATYEEADRVLLEAIWWHITLNTLISNHSHQDKRGLAVNRAKRQSR